MKPTLERIDGIDVVRDDLFPGGTKARFIATLFEEAEELVYASPAQGGAQYALATVARRLGKKATIFVAKRRKPHPRTLEARALGAQVYQVPCGYMTVVQARARTYAEDTGARLLPFGLDVPIAQDAIASAAASLGIEPEEVWCAAGSGVLARALAKAWPAARLHAVQVGRPLIPAEVAGGVIHIYPRRFEQTCRQFPPFPSDPHYDAKAWELCRERAHGKRTLFWNVAGPANVLA